MKLEEIMVKEVITARPEDPTASAAKQMREKGVGCLVITIDRTIKGIVTDRDFLACLSEGHNTYECKVSAHMSSPVVVEEPKEELLNAAEVMAQRKIKRLPVADDGKLLGIVSFSDISRVMHEQAQSFWPAWMSMTGLIRAQALQCRSKTVGRPR